MYSSQFCNTLSDSNSTLVQSLQCYWSHFQKLYYNSLPMTLNPTAFLKAKCAYFSFSRDTCTYKLTSHHVMRSFCVVLHIPETWEVDTSYTIATNTLEEYLLTPFEYHVFLHLYSWPCSLLSFMNSQEELYISWFCFLQLHAVAKHFMKLQICLPPDEVNYSIGNLELN